MSHLDYYKYQAEARRVYGPEDVLAGARAHGYRYQQMIGDWLPANKSARMVDLACGHGSFLVWLRDRGFKEISGVDSSPEQVRLARSAGLNIEEAGVLQWLKTRPPAACEALFAIDFIEHISKDDFMEFLALSAAALQPGGNLILRYPNGDSPFVGLNLFNDVTHVWTYTTTCLRCLAEMHGFSRCAFADEGTQAIRDARWLKVPVGRLAAWGLRAWFQAASREKIQYWNSCIWACLIK